VRILWIVGLAVGLLVLDRALLWVESRGWIYYRRTKPGRGAATYHLLEWNAVLDPTMRQVQEERVREKREEEESGAPPAGDHPGGTTEPEPERPTEGAGDEEEGVP
jgi:hypothetical protein